MNESEDKKNHNSCIGKLKCYLLSKQFIALIFFLLGIGGAFLVQNFINKRYYDIYSNHSNYEQQIKSIQAWQNEMDEWRDSFYTKIDNRMDRVFDNFYSSYFDPFYDMENLHRKMRDSFARFNNISSFIVSNKVFVSMEEDKEYTYYKLNFSGFNKDQIDIKILDNVLSFSANTLEVDKEKNKENPSEVKRGSNFYYSLPIAKNLDSKNPEISKEDNKIIVKFKKL